jgi:glycosyltransferase involved in cell wall biosynthesis
VSATPAERRPTLSAIVIAMNNERTIARCIESLRWADEIVVVDSGSTDRTVEICRELGAKVHVTSDWPGHGPQKNRALDLATGEWVISVDSDEWVTVQLREEIERALAAAGPRRGYAAPRRSTFCGREMRHSGWWPDYVLRVFRRESGRFTDDHTHERLVVTGRIGKLVAPIKHEAITDLDQMLLKMNAYSTASARMKLDRGARGSIPGAIAHGVWAFFRTYVLRLGFLDGREGFLLAVANAEGSYYRYVKLMVMHSEARGARRET